MAEEIAVENKKISNFQGLVTLTLDRVILPTVMHHSLTSTYIPNQRNFFVDGRTYARTDRHLRPILLGRITRVDPKRNLAQNVNN